MMNQSGSETEVDPKISAMQQQIALMQNEIASLHERNLRVEADKAWETSWARMVLLAILTYLFTSLVFWLIGVDLFLRNALIPTIGFILSTLTVPLCKSLWLKSRAD